MSCARWQIVLKDKRETVKEPELEKLPLPLERAGPAPHLGSTLEPTLWAEVWVSQPLSCEQGRPVPITHLSGSSMGSGDMPSSLLPINA